MDTEKRKKLGLLFKAVTALMLTVLMAVSIPLTAEAKTKAPKPAISEKKVTLLVTEIHQLSMSNVPAGKTVKWKTSNKKVVIVDTNGVIQGKKAGSAKVSAKIGKKSYTCKVTVKAGIDQKTAEMTVGDKRTVRLLGTKIKKVKTYNKNVATVEKTGEITAVGVGTTKVRLTGKNNKNYNCTVTVTPLRTVSFESNGGTSVSPQSLKPGEKVRKPYNPEKEGYAFDGWYTDSALTQAYDFATAVDADIVLYAKWLKLYTVTFDSNGGSSVSPVRVADGKTVNYPASPSKQDFSFDRWYSDKELKNAYDFSTPVTGDITLYAGWRPVFKVSFDTDGGDVINDVRIAENGRIAKPKDPAKDGFVFDGWYSDPECTRPFDFTTPITADTKIYVKWLNIYEITFDSNGGTTIVESQNVTEGEQVAVPDVIPERARYVFTKWYSDKACTKEYDFSLPVAGSFTLFAGWRERPLTRGEWVSALANIVSMNLDVDEENIDYFFEDTEGNANAIAIETAQAYGILPVDENLDSEDVPAFNPDGEATREFAMYTAVRAVGFKDGQETENTNSWTDWDEITYKNEAMLADKFDFCDVTGSAFEPEKPVLEADVTKAAAAINKLYESDKITEEKMDVDYKTGIRDLRENDYTDEQFSYRYDADEQGKTFVTASGTQVAAAAINVNDLLILPRNAQNPNGLGIKVKSIETEDGITTIETENPDLDELFDKVDMSQTVPAESLQNATPVPAEGVTVKVIKHDAQGNEEEDQSGVFYESADNFDLHIDKDKHFEPPAEYEFDLGEGIDLGHGAKVKGKVTIGIPDINVKVKGDLHLIGTKFDEVLFSMTENVKIEGGLYMTFAESGNQALDSFVPGRKELGRVPIPLGSSGFSIDVVFYFTYSVKGELTVAYTFDVTEGFHYQNGSVRGVFDFRDSLDMLNIKVEGKLGIGAALDLTFLEVWDLIGYKLEGGIALNASFTPHVLATQTLLCGDVTLYAYFEHGVDDNTIIGEWLSEDKGLTIKWEVLKNDADNPCKLKLHVENGQRVDECTFGRGELTGIVKDAATGQLLSGAQIKLFDAHTQHAVRTKTTGADGRFNFDNLAPGDYKVEVRATGYMLYNADTKVEKNATKYLETPLMIDRSVADGEAKKVSGMIMDGIHRDTYVDDVHYVLRNLRDGALVQEGDITGHKYEFTLKPGNYGLTVSKAEYTTRTIRLVVSGASASGGNVVLIPENYQYEGQLEGEMRVVLTWGENPWDVDSHIFGPNGNGGRFHVYYGSKNYYENEQLTVNLDVDDVDSYGPETTTVVKLKDSGKYSFYLHDYTNKGRDNSMALSYSDARVYLYFGDALYDMYAIPEGFVGTSWHVFDYDAQTHSVIPRNTFYPHAPGVYDSDTFDAPADGSYPAADDEVYSDLLEINKSDELKKAG